MDVTLINFFYTRYIKGIHFVQGTRIIRLYSLSKSQTFVHFKQLTWKVPFGILSISLSWSSIRLILFKKWKDVAGKDRILLLLKSRCCKFVNDLNGRFGISEIVEERPWDILNVNREWPTYV